MAIRRFLDFDGKDCIGFVNYGNNVENDQLAKEALVFMLTCVKGSWKISLGYFIIGGISAQQKATLVQSCIDIVTSECGVDVSVTFDGCPTNFAMSKFLDCKLGEEIDPSFKVSNNDVVIIPDPSHMLKLIRNTLGEKGPITNAQGGTISWDYVKFLLELQENEGLHLGNKLNESHVNFTKQIMKVKALSNSVADAIEFCDQELKLESFKNSAATVDFIRKINNLFDIMNSRNLKSYVYNKPISVKNYQEIKLYLDDMFNYLPTEKRDFGDF